MTPTSSLASRVTKLVTIGILAGMPHGSLAQPGGGSGSGSGGGGGPPGVTSSTTTSSTSSSSTSDGGGAGMGPPESSTSDSATGGIEGGSGSEGGSGPPGSGGSDSATGGGSGGGPPGGSDSGSGDGSVGGGPPGLISSTDDGSRVVCDETGANAHYEEFLSGSGSTMARVAASNTGCANHVAWDINPTEGKETPSNESIPAYPMMFADDGTTDLSSAANAIGILRNGVAMFSAWAKDKVVDYEDTAFYIEADTFDLCGGHATPDGTYHFHGTPGCLQEQAMIDAGTSADEHSALLGWAYDGFPIYGQLGPDGIEMKMCGLEGADETVCLDICSGYEALVPEADEFTYRYYSSCGFDESFFPFVTNCFRGCCPDGLECSQKVEACGDSPVTGYTDAYVPVAATSLDEQYDTDLIVGDDTDFIDSTYSVNCTLYMGSPGDLTFATTSPPASTPVDSGGGGGGGSSGGEGGQGGPPESGSSSAAIGGGEGNGQGGGDGESSGGDGGQRGPPGSGSSSSGIGGGGGQEGGVGGDSSGQGSGGQGGPPDIGSTSSSSVGGGGGGGGGPEQADGTASPVSGGGGGGGGVGVGEPRESPSSSPTSSPSGSSSSEDSSASDAALPSSSATGTADSSSTEEAIDGNTTSTSGAAGQPAVAVSSGVTLAAVVAAAIAAVL